MVVGICEDNPVFLIAIENAVNLWQEKHPDVQINIRQYTRAELLLYDWEDGTEYDILFLDIELENMNGYELAKRIREKDVRIPIVFVTNYDTYLMEGYTVSIYRYLKKPIQPKQIAECLDYADRMRDTLIENYFSLKENDISLRIPLRDIVYISAESHKARIYTAEKHDYVISIKAHFEEIMEKLPTAMFIRCHRGFIINMRNVFSYSSGSVIMFNGSEIPVGRKYRSSTLNRLNHIFFGVDE